METLQAILEGRLRPAVNRYLESEGVSENPGEAQVSIATDARFGDYQSNIAMQIAKAAKRNPRQVATGILEKFEAEEFCELPEIAGAGFLNFRIKPDFLKKHLGLLVKDARMGVPSPDASKKIVLDFSGPNIAKPMHVGHIRSTILGDTLARVARFLGHNVITDNHLGDWGTQFGKVIYGLKNLKNEAALKQDPVAELVRLYRDVNALSEKDAEVLATCREELVKLQKGDPENVSLWKQCIEWSRSQFEEIYRLLDVHFDEWLGESFYNDRLQPLVERLQDKGIAEQSEGAICVFFREDEQLADKPCLIRKSDGGFLYATTDLATIEYRVEKWNPDAIWYVTGAPQQLHFQQVFEVAKKMGVATGMKHIAFGSILGEDRKLMKTRSGENVQLRDLLYEAHDRALEVLKEKDFSAEEKEKIAWTIGLGAVKYAELSQYRMTDYVFSWDKMLSFQGNTAPYLQNAYVRIRSIFRKLEGEFDAGAPLKIDEAAEIALAKKLAQFGEIVPTILDDFRPNILANYLYELANTFHGFYEECPVLKAEGDVRASRLVLCDLTARMLEKGLFLLGISVPERM